MGRNPAASAPASRSAAAAPSGRPRAVGRRRSVLRRLARILGPGPITGASDDDPSGIGTYAVAGASLGLATLWTAVVTFPLVALLDRRREPIAVVTSSLASVFAVLRMLRSAR